MNQFIMQLNESNKRLSNIYYVNGTFQSENYDLDVPRGYAIVATTGASDYDVGIHLDSGTTDEG